MARKKESANRESKKISREEFQNLIKDIEVSDSELAQYFTLDGMESDGFAPSVIVNESLISDNNEGARLLNSANSIARWRRNRRYRKRIKNWNGIKIVAEGDSWFQYPFVLKDVIDQLSDLDQFSYAIFGLSEAGDLLSNIVAEDELTNAIQRENPDVFLLSGGGNDMVGNERMATLVHPFKAGRKAEDYPNEKFDEFLEELGKLYKGLFARLIQQFPHLKIVCHGYDDAIPSNGPWLGKPLIKQQIKSAKLQRDIVAEMIRRFNEELENLVLEFPGAVFHVDCRGVVGSKTNWYDELHPRNKGYFEVAKKFDTVIKQALSMPTISPHFESDINIVSGIGENAKPLTGLRELGDDEFAELVVARAEMILDEQVKSPKDKVERRQIEQGFEKINYQSDFLPSSFLEVGVTRAQSVCRISTIDPLGKAFASGFLIGTRGYIMTNNHVLENEDMARSSVLEFDYDQDSVEYRAVLRPDKFFITSKELDFTIVACDASSLPNSIEAVQIPTSKHLITRKERVNIVQHPQGRRKEIAIHDNTVTYVYDKAIRYSADTERGSSGAPVFNNNWQLCALHHAGWKKDTGGATNEGVRITSIVDYLRSNIDEHNDQAIQEILTGQNHAKPIESVSETQGINSAESSLTINIANQRREIVINVSD